MPDIPIILRQKVLSKSRKKHNLTIDDLQGLPSALATPIFVFKSSDNTVSVLTELESNKGENIFVAIQIGANKQIGHNILEVNDILTIHGREIENVINPIIENDSLVWADKRKGLNWLSSAKSNSQAIANKALVSAANIVENFENPKVPDENMRLGSGALTDDDLANANDPVSKLLGKSTRTARQRREFAERERGRMVERVRELAETLHLDNVGIVTDASTLQGNRAKAKGFYSRSTRRITIVIPNQTSVFDAEQTLLHEAVAHYGLRQLFGEHFDTFLDNVFQNADTDVRRHIVELAERRGWDFRTATEEYLASLAENTNFENVNASWWSKIKELFLRMLHKIGFEDFSGVTLSDNELRYILWRSYENLAEPGRYRSILGEAADVVKQYELKVGNFAPSTEAEEQVAELHEADITKAERIRKLRESRPVEITGNEIEASDDLKQYKKNALEYGKKLQGSYVNKDTGRTIQLQRGRRNGGLKEVLQHDLSDKAHVQSIAAIPQIIENAIYVDSEKNSDETKNPNVSQYHYYVCGLKIGGEDYTVRMVEAEEKDGSRYYDHKLSRIEKGKLLNELAHLNSSSSTELSSTPGTGAEERNRPTNRGETQAAPISNVKDKRLLSILQADGGENDILFRENRDIDHGIEAEAASLARSVYEEAVKDTGDQNLLQALWHTMRSKEDRERFKHKFSESYFDYSRSVKALQDALGKALGRRILDFENPWQALNAKSSVDDMEIQEAMFRYVEPLTEHIAHAIRGKRIDGRRIELDDVEKYLNAKHGSERNAHMAERELARRTAKGLEAFRLKEAEELSRQGYSGEEVEAIVEADAGTEEARLRQELWPKVRKDYAGLTALLAEETDGNKNVDELERAAAEYCRKFEGIIGRDAADELWRLASELNGFSLRKAYLSGLIGKEQYDEVQKMYRYYVPLRGWHDNYAGDVYQYISRGDGGKMLQGVLKTAYGRKSRAGNILGTMAAMANTAIVQGNRNLVAQKLLNLAFNTKGAGLLMVGRQWYEEDATGTLVPVHPDLKEGMSAEEMQAEIERFEEDMEAKAAEDNARVVARTFGKDFPLKIGKWQERQHSVRVLRNGREHTVYVLGNPKAAQALNGMLNPDRDVSVIEEALMKWMRFKAQMQTNCSPEFLISNFQRDVLTATAGTYVKYGRKTAGRFAKNLWTVLPATPGKDDLPAAGIFGLLRKQRKGTLDRSVAVERMFDEFCRNGGMTGISRMLGAEDYERKMAAAVRHVRMGAADLPRQALNGLMESVQFLNNGIENATRFAAYLTARQEGKTVGDAIADAKDASVNFNMKGSGAWGNLWMRRYILYSNPALQSLRMLGTWYEASPKRFMGMMAGTMAASFAMALLWWSLGGGDDDDDNDWYGLSEWNRYNYINLKTGGGYLHWSIPQEFRPAWALGQIAFDWQAGRLTTERALHGMAMQLNNLTPVAFIAGGLDTKDSWIESGIKAWTPTLAADFIDAYGWNEDFLGRRITGQETWNADAPEWQRVTEDTPAWAVGLSRTWNEATGGRRNRKSWWDSEYLNPGAVYYILQQQAGGLGSLVTKCTRLGEQWANPEEEVEAKNVPFVSKFWVSTGDDYSKHRVLNDRFYLKWNEWRLADYEVRRLISDLNNWKSHATLTLLAKQDCPLWLQYD